MESHLAGPRGSGLMRGMRRWAIPCLAALAFFAPLKFGTPVVNQTLLLPPTDWFEWLFFSWPNQLAVIFVFGAFGWMMLDSARLAVRVDALLVLPVLFLATQAVAAVDSIHPHVSVDAVAHFAACVILFYAAAWYVRDGASAARVFGGLGLATFVVCILALQQYFGGLQETREFAAANVDASRVPVGFLDKLTSNRVFGSLVYPNALAGFLVVAFGPVLAWIWARSRNWDTRMRWPVLIFAGALMVFCLVLTGSRGGFVAFAVAVALALLRAVRTGAGRAMTAAAVGLAVLAVVFVVAQRGGVARLTTSSLEARLNYWSGAVAIAREHPWLGTGPGTFGSMYPAYKTAGLEEAQIAHNDLLQMWSDSGVLAFLVFGALWLVAVKDAFALARQRPGDVAALAICASVTGWAVHALVDFDLFVPGVAMPVFVLLGSLQGLKEPERGEPGTVAPRGRSEWPVAAVTALVIGGVVWVEGRALAASYAFGRAHELLARQEPVAALVEAERAVALVPRSAHYQVLAGDLAWELGNGSGAVSLYRAAIQNDPFRASYHWRLAQALWRVRGHRDEALYEFQRAVELNPTKAEYHKALGEAEETVRQSGAGLLRSPPAGLE